MPALRIASILSPAVPLPPDMIAPAWPMRRPGGAAAPAMKPTIGFLRRGGVFFGAPPFFAGGAADLADHDDCLGLVVGEKHLQHVSEIEPVYRVAADADAARLAET